MIIISDKLTTGQITFILRVVIQILSYAGLFILGLIILGNTPRVAPVETHDVLNRLVGKSTATFTSMKWITKRLGGSGGDPTPSFRLLLAILLFLFYGLFVSVSDIGFIGFYACTVPGANSVDFPASVKTDDDALRLVRANLINGTDPASVLSHRCDAAEPHVFSVNVTERNCTAWHNATYADGAAFRGFNSTDSDVLMPLRLAPFTSSSDPFYLNMYYRGAGAQRVRSPVIANGLVVEPHDLGMRVVVGVPSLSKQQKVTIPKTMAVEVDIGCMSLGVVALQDPGSLELVKSRDVYMLNDTVWRHYKGPAYLSEVLSQTVDKVREQLLPLFNTSLRNVDGDYLSFNRSWGTFSPRTNIATFFLPDQNGLSGVEASAQVLGDCTQQLNQRLGLPLSKATVKADSCDFLQLGGSFAQDGRPVQALSRLLCATATQVNMVSATVEVDAEERVSVGLNRLPSNLNLVEADYWRELHSVVNPGDTAFDNTGPIQRYTLSDNATGPLNHFIFQESSLLTASTDFLEHGVGSPGPVFTTVGSRMTKTTIGEEVLNSLDDEFYQSDFNNSRVLRWAGEIGGSYILASVGYNGWAARSSPPLTVLSTGGRAATCFKTPYGAAFLPLFIAALVVICWGVLMLLSSTLAGAKRLERAYGGMTPYARSVGPTGLPDDTLLVWQDGPHPRLGVALNGSPLPNDPPGFLVRQLAHEKP
ncbi:hypothetical protein LshimejAT787_2300200 [Lyophyllum shimeji]|uniref:Uncharacterized protein n=1 Tax=Lyophyllum shimeji TaxID=47721 RepID=A0A9P3UV43_LYOSH|nr:hypothetical protein LshimejAT787_2300200 [Lyophyllum shimeji]